MKSTFSSPEVVRFSIRAKLFLLVLMSFGLLIAAMVMIIGHRAQIVADAEVERALQRARSVFQTRLRSQFDNLQTVAENLVHNATVRPAIGERETSLLQDISHELQPGLGFDLMIITDAAGEVIAWSDQPDAIGLSMSDKSHLFKTALAGRPEQGFMNRRGELLQIVAVPVRDNIAQDIVRGSLALAYRLSDSLIQEIKDLTGSDIMVYSLPRNSPGEPGLPPVFDKGTLTNKNSELVSYFTNLATVPPEHYEGKDFHNQSIEINRETYHVSFIPLSKSDGVPLGFVAVLKSRSDLIRPFVVIQQAVLAVGLLCVAAASLSALIIARRISRPVIDLVKVTQRIGQADYPEYRLSERGDEIGVLNNAVLKMGQILKERSELEAYLAGISLELDGNRVSQVEMQDYLERVPPAKTRPEAVPEAPTPDLAETRPAHSLMLQYPESGESGLTVVSLSPPGTEHLPVGGIIDGRYEIISELGRGGMGTVYLAHDGTLMEKVAIKVISNQGLPKGAVNMFKQELRLARKITHPNVLRNHDFGLLGERCYISMEYVQGVTLYDLIRRKGPFNLRIGLMMARQLCAAMAAAHREGIVHRDLKPNNVIINNRGILKIMDFGLALHLGDQKGDGGGNTICGTPHFMAPEQFLAMEIDERADIYALGITLFYVFTGSLPFKGGTVGALMHQHLHEEPLPIRIINTDLPERLESLLLKTMQKDKEKRPQSVTEMLAALDTIPLENSATP